MSFWNALNFRGAPKYSSSAPVPPIALSLGSVHTSNQEQPKQKSIRGPLAIRLSPNLRRALEDSSLSQADLWAVAIQELSEYRHLLRQALYYVKWCEAQIVDPVDIDDQRYFKFKERQQNRPSSPKRKRGEQGGKSHRSKKRRDSIAPDAPSAASCAVLSTQGTRSQVDKVDDLATQVQILNLGECNDNADAGANAVRTDMAPAKESKETEMIDVVPTIDPLDRNKNPTAPASDKYSALLGLDCSDRPHGGSILKDSEHTADKSTNLEDAESASSSYASKTSEANTQGRPASSVATMKTEVGTQEDITTTTHENVTAATQEGVAPASQEDITTSTQVDITTSGTTQKSQSGSSTSKKQIGCGVASAWLRLRNTEHGPGVDTIPFKGVFTHKATNADVWKSLWPFLFPPSTVAAGDDTEDSAAAARPRPGPRMNLLFAYGQSGAGKSYSLLDRSDSLIQRSASHLLRRINAPDSSPFPPGSALYVQCVQEVMNRLYDMLTPDSNRIGRLGRPVRERNPSLNNVSYAKVTDLEQLQSLLKQIKSRRCIEPTASNPRSSRGHVLVKLFVAEDDDGGVPGSLLCLANVYSTHAFVDLCGIELKPTGRALSQHKHINFTLNAVRAVLHLRASSPTSRHLADASTGAAPVRGAFAGNDSVFMRLLAADGMLGEDVALHLFVCAMPQAGAGNGNGGSADGGRLYQQVIKWAGDCLGT